MGDIDQSLLNDISALADNEIRDNERKEELMAMIAVDAELRYEYELQLGMKNLVRDRLGAAVAPAVLKASIKDKITSEIDRKEESKFSLLAYIKGSRYVIPGIAVVLVIFLFSYVLLKNNRIEPLLQEQTGTNNMVVQAQENFKLIKNGMLNLQIQCSNPQTLKNFFADNGVSYDPKIPMYEYWNLEGGVVSDHNGVKLAHHLYTGDEGELVYVYQISNTICSKKKAVLLSEELLRKLEGGEVLSGRAEGYCMFVWQNNENIFVLVSNEEMDKIEEKFIAGI